MTHYIMQMIEEELIARVKAFIESQVEVESYMEYEEVEAICSNLIATYTMEYKVETDKLQLISEAMREALSEIREEKEEEEIAIALANDVPNRPLTEGRNQKRLKQKAMARCNRKKHIAHKRKKHNRK